MTISQKRAIYYKERQKELHNQECFLIWKNLYNDFQQSKYKSMVWYIKHQGLYMEYIQACYYYDNNLENLPRKI